MRWLPDQYDVINSMYIRHTG